VAYSFTQPMEMRLDETVTGIRGDVAMKTFGDSLRVLEDLGKRMLSLISSIPGAADAQMEPLLGAAELRVNMDRPALARYGLNVSDVQEVIETLVGEQPVSEMIEGRARFPISVRLPEVVRSSPDALEKLTPRAPGGELVRLDQVAQKSEPFEGRKRFRGRTPSAASPFRPTSAEPTWGASSGWRRRKWRGPSDFRLVMRFSGVGSSKIKPAQAED
jgi:Cu/Ag efflux pump CusA